MTIPPPPPDPKRNRTAGARIAVSIVVPVYNAEEYLDECLGSLRAQTLQSIEILCYDDASTDSSAAILREHARQDDRVRLVQYPENRSSFQARKDGALAARGEYLMYVDADDFLAPTACERLVKKTRRLGVDILHFGTNVINAGEVEPGRITHLKKLLTPLERRLTGREPFEYCFIQNKYGHSLWNKIFRTEFAQQALAKIPDGRYPKAQDLLAYYVLAWHATSYAGTPEAHYNYRFGAGITGATEMTLDRMRTYATQSLVADAIDAFAASHGNPAELVTAAQAVRQRLAGDCAMQWFRNVPAKLAPAAFDALCESWPVAELVDALQRTLRGGEAKVATRLRGARILSRPRKPIGNGSTIALYYHRITIGGIPRVLCLLSKLYLEMGYRVVMMLDEEHPGREFQLPPDVVRVQLPVVDTDGGYLQRALALRQAILDHDVDAVVYCAASSPLLLWDMLITKSLEVAFLVSIHDSAFHSLLNGTPGLATRPKVMRLADAVQVLSTAEEVFWRSQGARAVCLPNPVTTGLADEADLDPEPGNLLWVGRLDVWVKQCLELPKIMAVVRRRHPEARLHIVGEEWTQGVRQKMEKQMRRLGVEENIVFCGPTFEVERYYRKASVLLITSVTECSPMTVVEARAFGVPIAMFSLPHISMLQDGLGFVEAPQGDSKELGLAISALLDDEDQRRALGQAGRAGLATFIDVDRAAPWRYLFALATDPNPAGQAEAVPIKDIGNLLSNALDIYLAGIERRRRPDARQLRKAAASSSKSRISRLRARLTRYRRAVTRRLRRMRPTR